MIDLADKRAIVLFSFSKAGSPNNYIELDPRMGSLIIFEQSVLVDDEQNLTSKQSLFEVDTFSPENFPEYFDAGIVPFWVTSWGASPLTSRDFLTKA